jgi:hypothetical protein
VTRSICPPGRTGPCWRRGSCGCARRPCTRCTSGSSKARSRWSRSTRRRAPGRRPGCRSDAARRADVSATALTAGVRTVSMLHIMCDLPGRQGCSRFDGYLASHVYGLPALSPLGSYGWVGSWSSGTTKVPQPGRITTRPSSASRATALRTVPRAMP